MSDKPGITKVKLLTFGLFPSTSTSCKITEVVLFTIESFFFLFAEKKEHMQQKMYFLVPKTSS